MLRPAALAVVLLSALAVPLAALVGGGVLATALWIAAAAAWPAALAALGAARPDRPGRRPAALALALGAALVAGLVLAARTRGGAGIGALVAGVWFLPFAIVSLGFAVDFDRFGPSRSDLERLRRAAPPPGDDG